MATRRFAVTTGLTCWGTSVGAMSDDDPTCTLNQYLAGGLSCVSERMACIEADRLALWRHCLPATGAAARPLELTRQGRFPELFHTHHRGAVGSWDTISLINWYPEARTQRMRLRDLLPQLSGPTQHRWRSCHPLRSTMAPPQVFHNSGASVGTVSRYPTIDQSIISPAFPPGGAACAWRRKA